MKYQNPIIPGFYPDPSICKKGNDYYLVTSSFEYFPGVPLFHSTDLVNWRQIGHCLTRKSQLDLDGCGCSKGIYAPTIRYHDHQFYMITTLVNKDIKTFYVTAKDPREEWSDPIYLDIEGIDPSFYFEAGRTYVQYADYSTGISVIKQVEIELETGNLLGVSEIISHGSGGRDIEAPHIFKRDRWYYLMLAEGGTREGHMVTLARSESLWGPFEPCPSNPILSNRDLGTAPIQSVGHADLIEDENGNPWLVALGTRPYKHRTTLGRETMLSGAYWDEDGWLYSKLGYMPEEVEITVDLNQSRKTVITLDQNTTKLPLDITTLRSDITKYLSFEDSLKVSGNQYTLDDLHNPVFLGIRQSAYDFELTLNFGYEPENARQEAGLALVMDNEHHLELVVTTRCDKKVLLLRKNVGDIVTERKWELIHLDEPLELKISGSQEKYHFWLKDCHQKWIELDWSYTKHLASESSFSAFTGVVTGLYVTGNQVATVTKLDYRVLSS